MKNSLVLLLCLTCSIVTWAQNTPQKNGVNFVNESITTILQPNNNAQKPVMVFVWTSDYCGACKRMQNNVWNDLSVAAFFNRYFTNVSIDLSDEQSIEKNQELLDDINLLFFQVFTFIVPRVSI
ncbi:MAG: thioredoxin family protein [Sphingobacteriales bacterium]|nr:thioredoxin family protein [Sphingobacteriales bacterium]